MKIKIKEKYIIIHSDITGLLFKNFSLKKKLWEIIYLSFGEKKNIYFSCFFTFKSNLIWNYNKTKSDAGVLSEYFRKNISNKRTIHPIHSVAIFGNKNSEIPDQKCESSFGTGSIWEWFCKNKNVCNIALGLNLDGGGTFCHYSEEKAQVGYRKYINLKSKVINKNNKILKKKIYLFC